MKIIFIYDESIIIIENFKIGLISKENTCEKNMRTKITHWHSDIY